MSSLGENCVAIRPIIALATREHRALVVASRLQADQSDRDLIMDYLARVATDNLVPSPQFCEKIAAIIGVTPVALFDLAPDDLWAAWRIHCAYDDAASSLKRYGRDSSAFRHDLAAYSLACRSASAHVMPFLDIPKELPCPLNTI